MKMVNHKSCDLNDFVLSRCNKKAAEKCLQVVTDRTEKGSFVFVYGPSPCGKTKLSAALSEAYKNKYGNDATVLSFSSMVDDFLKSIYKKTKNDFLQKYSAGKLLLIDDTQSILGFSSTQAAFADIFAYFLEQGISIIFFSEYKLKSFEELNSGLKKQHINLVKVNMGKADFALRKKVLFNILNKEKTTVSSKILYYIAINKKIELASFKGCIAKINLMKTIEQKEFSDKQVIKILKEYER